MFDELVKNYPQYKFTDEDKLRWEREQRRRRRREIGQPVVGGIIPGRVYKKRRSKRKGLGQYLRVAVYERSKGLCEDCGAKGAAVHHIKSVNEFPELQFELSNLIHLCRDCHADRHPNMPRVLFTDNKFVTKVIY